MIKRKRKTDGNYMPKVGQYLLVNTYQIEGECIEYHEEGIEKLANKIMNEHFKDVVGYKKI